MGGPVLKQSRRPTQAFWQGPVSLKGHEGDTGFACFRQLRPPADPLLERSNCWAQMLFKHSLLWEQWFVDQPVCDTSLQGLIPETDGDHILSWWRLQCLHGISSSRFIVWNTQCKVELTLCIRCAHTRGVRVFCFLSEYSQQMITTSLQCFIVKWLNSKFFKNVNFQVNISMNIGYESGYEVE